MDILPILSTLRRHKVTAALVILEIALTCAIVCNAVFLVGQRLDNISTPSGIVENELLQITANGIGDQPDAHARITADLAGLRQISGVDSVTMANQVPFGSSSWNSSIKLSLDQKRPTVQSVTVYYGEDIPKVFGVEIIAGRAFQTNDYTWFDDAAKSGNATFPKIAIISDALARKLFPDGNAVGKTIVTGTNEVRIVGVVKRLTRPSIMDYSTAGYSMLLPIRMTMSMGASFIIRTQPAERERVLAAAVTKLKAMDNRRVITEKRTFDDVRKAYFASDRAMTGLLIGVCVALMIVTALGIVGLGSFWVAQRRRQIGVRRALGARRKDILRYFQTENFLLATIGIVIGMVMAFGINLLLMAHYELPRLPAIYFPVGAVLLWLLGQVAVLGPALRAASVPPVVATRG
ncbi:putative ABC transport system permease protein [Luteibacter rhizovicinus]|uniref:Putative ABC transport system permease protein n=1 Tax=Luteibacter rhizovicinus TaxID=242606 RepID=A0A4R3YQ20_9GAMM|nr:FtsX-like permease family protein [Luteibacter rhizovicinus]TCV95005.1 putative ABC transport system permease protein [Luteibacter rhizovicinus]